MATTLRDTGSESNDLPIDESRHLVAKCTGTIGYPDEHAIAVAECSLLIADQLAVAADVRQTIARGALLHDVGKLRVDDSILSKPGPLTRAERRRIEQHPVEGEQIIAEFGRAWGRPGRTRASRALGRLRLSRRAPGADIPLAARVVAVADAYLAMREERPYRKRVDKQAAVRELNKCAGSQFDPVCVQALIRAV